MQTIADPTLRLDAQAQNLLSLLSRREPTFARWNKQAQAFEVTFSTYVLYRHNQGRCALVMHPNLQQTGPCKVIIFGEAPATTDIRIESWDTLCRAPTNFEELDTEAIIEEFPTSELVRAVEFIVSEFERSYKELSKGMVEQILAEKA